MNHSESPYCLLQVNDLTVVREVVLFGVLIPHSSLPPAPVCRKSTFDFFKIFFREYFFFFYGGNSKSLKLIPCFEMRDKADVVAGNVVNKPTDILFTNVAFIFITAPLTT